MFDRSRATRLPVLAVAALLLVLGLLAALQYRWVDQVGEAERARLQAGARTRVGQLAQDFDREVTRAFAWLQVDADMLGPDGGARYAARYDRWAARTEHLGLVSAVYVTVAGEASPRLRRFDPAAREFVDAEWPAELAGLREKLEASDHEGGPRFDHEGGARPDREGGPRPEHGGAMRGPFGFVFEEAPALVTPILAADARGEGRGEAGRGEAERGEAGRGEAGRGEAGRGEAGRGEAGRGEAGRAAEHERAERPGGRLRPAGHVIILFDRAYIQRELLPALASRYFTSGGEFDYCVVVTSRRDPHGVVYRSDPDDGAHPAPDATAGLLEVRFDQLDAALPRGGDPAAPAFLSRRPAREGWRGSPRPLPYVDRGLWEVGVTHRSGSLEQVVARTRHRNLMISFGTLLLLGASAAMVLVSAQRARHLAAQQVEFVAGVSHELRTPVAVVCSAGENLADGLVRDPADVRVYGATIRDEGRRLSEMIEQVLEYAGIAAREGRRTGETVEVASLVQDAVKSCAAVLAEAGIVIETRVPPGLPRLAGDRAALRRALQNLIQNAARHAAAGRWIGVSAEASGAGRGGRVRLSVRDRGPGIAAGEESRIFQAFYRGKQALSAGISGSGLGLSLVQRIVESHGGQVEVENTPGGGCAFTLVLPAQAAAAEPVAPVGEKDAQANPAR